MTEAPRLDPAALPVHVAVIMDGNGRWAQKRNLPRPVGHRQGVESVREIVTNCRDLGINHPHPLRLFHRKLEPPAPGSPGPDGPAQDLPAGRTGQPAPQPGPGSLSGPDRTDAADESGSILETAIAKTADNTGLNLNLALSYGGRARNHRRGPETGRRVYVAGALKPEEITEEILAAHLYTAGQPDPDLLIRTGGESRLSNFLLWQLSYAEIYITETLWPEFRHDQLLEALADFQRRQRRFGRTPEQVSKP